MKLSHLAVSQRPLAREAISAPFMPNRHLLVPAGARHHQPRPSPKLTEADEERTISTVHSLFASIQ